MADKEGFYMCGDMGNKLWNCSVATRLGREEKLKEVRIEEGLFLDGVMVPNDKVPMSSQAYDGTSYGKWKFYSLYCEKLVSRLF